MTKTLTSKEVVMKASTTARQALKSMEYWIRTDHLDEAQVAYLEAKGLVKDMAEYFKAERRMELMIEPPSH